MNESFFDPKAILGESLEERHLDAQGQVDLLRLDPEQVSTLRETYLDMSKSKRSNLMRGVDASAVDNNYQVMNFANSWLNRIDFLNNTLLILDSADEAKEVATKLADDERRYHRRLTNSGGVDGPGDERMHQMRAIWDKQELLERVMKERGWDNKENS